MNGQLAALMALALHGNACLAAPDAPVPSLLAGNSAFAEVGSLTIIDRRGRWRPQEVVFTDTADWFEHLRDERVTHLALLDAHAATMSQEMAAGLTAGVRWGLAGTARRGRRSWGATWGRTPDGAPGQREWAVRLAYDPAASTTVVAAPGVNLATAGLDHALEDAAGFAGAHGLAAWRERFDRARDQLHAPVPVLPHHEDIAPPGALSLKRAQLLAAAMTAWVFGGVGSWNDIGLDGVQSEGEMARATRRLYEAVMAAFLAVTNAAPAVG